LLLLMPSVACCATNSDAAVADVEIEATVHDTSESDADARQNTWDVNFDPSDVLDDRDLADAFAIPEEWRDIPLADFCWRFRLGLAPDGGRLSFGGAPMAAGNGRFFFLARSADSSTPPVTRAWYVVGVDAFGHPLFAAPVPAEIDEPTNIVLDPNGEIVLLGQQHNDHGEFFYAHVTRFSNSGAVLWSMVPVSLYGDPSRSGHLTSDVPAMDLEGTLYFVLGMTLTAVDRAGVQVWSVLIDAPSRLAGNPCNFEYTGAWQPTIQGQTLWVANPSCGLLAYSLKGNLLAVFEYDETAIVPTPWGSVLQKFFTDATGVGGTREVRADGSVGRSFPDGLYLKASFFDRQGNFYGIYSGILGYLRIGKDSSTERLDPELWGDSVWVDETGAIIGLRPMASVVTVLGADRTLVYKRRLGVGAMVGRAGRVKAVMIRQGEMVLRTVSSTAEGSAGAENLDCFRLPVGTPQMGVWSTLPEDFGNRRFVDGPSDLSPSSGGR
jgi:hypothetical protein